MAVLRREATSGWWGSRNPVLADGEFGVELDTGLSKIGDGSTAWNALSYSDELDEIDASPLGGSDGDLVGLDGQGGFKRVGSGTYRQNDDPLFMSAAAFVNTGGSPSLTHISNNPVWLLDASSIERVSAFSPRIPTGWSTVNINLYWTNAGAGSGDVVWLLRTGQAVGDGDTLASPSSGSAATATAPSQNVVEKTVVASGVSVSVGEVVNLYLIRNASDGSDTLGNDAGVLWVEIEKAS